MKKKLTIALLLFIGAASVFAQDQKFRFGLNGTTGYSWLKSHPESNGLTSTTGEASFGYGIALDWKLGDNYAFTTGIDILYKGGGLKYTPVNAKDSVSMTTRIAIQNLEIPLLLKMKTNAIGYITYFAQFGGSLGVPLSRTGYYKVIDSHKIGTKTTYTGSSLDNFVQPFSVSLIIAAGAEYNLSGKTSLVGSLFFNNAFNNLLKEQKGFPNGKPEGTTSVFSSRLNVLGIRVGVFF